MSIARRLAKVNLVVVVLMALGIVAVPDVSAAPSPESLLAVSVAATQNCDGHIVVFAQDSNDRYLQSLGSGSLNVYGSTGAVVTTKPWIWTASGVIATFSLPPASYSVGIVDWTSTGQQFIAGGAANLPPSCADSPGKLGVAIAGTESCSGNIVVMAQDSSDHYLQTNGSGTLYLWIGANPPADNPGVPEQWAWNQNGVLATFSLPPHYYYIELDGSTTSRFGNGQVGAPLDCPDDRSPHWAGYALDHSPLQPISAQITVPAVSSSCSDTTFSSFWVGYNGYTKDTNYLPQVGFNADCYPSGTRGNCARGSGASYWLWWELNPHKTDKQGHGAQPICQPSIGPGDKVSLRVQPIRTGVEMAIGVRHPDGSTGQWSKRFAFGTDPISKVPRNASYDTMECIVEAPNPASATSRQPLSNFGAVVFDNCTALLYRGDGTNLHRLDFNNGAAKTTPFFFDLQGSSHFTVTWYPT